MEALVGQMTSAYGDFVRQDDMALTNLASSEIEIGSPKIKEIPEIPKIPKIQKIYKIPKITKITKIRNPTTLTCL